MISYNGIYKQVLKQLVQFCLWVAMVRFSNGAALILMSILGVIWAFNGKSGKAICMHVMITFMTILNPHILAKVGSLYNLGLRVGPLLIGLALMFAEMSKRNKQRLPMGLLLLYLLAACISSMSGWAPFISFMKLANFTVFFLGLWLGTKGLSRIDGGAAQVKTQMLALATFLVFGSIALYPFPGISTMQGLRQFGEVGDVAAINELITEAMAAGGMSLFCGVTAHSQTFAPLLVCVFAFMLCDMLFVEKRLMWLHSTLLVCALPFIYASRSRVAFFSLIVLMLLVYFYLPKMIYLDAGVKRWLGSVLLCAGALLVIVTIVSEIKSDAISRWVRKVENVDSDRRTLTEAITSSRQGLVEMCMDDFRRNPALGMGFQVAYYTPDLAAQSKGLVFSSPIEKGVLPIMVLGEGGIVGVTVFIIFLLSFYVGCANRRLYITATMMTLMLSMNLGEATFFSPGGVGGIEWVMCIIGGYVLDVSILSSNMRHVVGGYGRRFISIES